MNQIAIQEDEVVQLGEAFLISDMCKGFLSSSGAHK